MTEIPSNRICRAVTLCICTFSIMSIITLSKKTLNRIPKFRRKPPETCRSRTLYLDWAEEDGSHEPYYQPVVRRGTSPISVDTISIQTTIRLRGCPWKRNISYLHLNLYNFKPGAKLIEALSTNAVL